MPEGGGSDTWATEAGIGMRVTLDRITPGSERDLGAGQGRKRGVIWTRDGSHRLAQGTPFGYTES